MARLSFFVAALLSFAIVPAAADGPVSVYGGPYFFTDHMMQGALAGAIGLDFGLGYDFGRGASKVRYRIDLDDAFVASTGARFGLTSAGGSVRLASPFYAGAGVSLDHVTLRQIIYDVCPGVETIGFSCSPETTQTTAATSLGSNVFVGQKIVSARGIGLSIEAAYATVRAVRFTNLGGVRVGVRASF